MALLSRYVQQADGTYEESFTLREVPLLCEDGQEDPELILVELGDLPPPLPDDIS